MPNHLTSKLAITALLLGAGWAVQAAEADLSECAFPEVPSVPDGASATEEEMGAAAAAVRAYVDATQAGLTCLGDLEASLGEEITDEQRQSIVASYNAHVDKLNNTANAYNEAVRTFKAR
jgi:hypothetical protein